MASKTVKDTAKFIKQVAAQKNVAAQKTLESIIKAKVEARVKETLAEQQRQEESANK